MDINFNKYQILDKFSVSRETFYLLEHYKELVLKKNEQINLISRKNADNFVERHILDCAQAIDFIDKNCKSLIDLGSGAGFPGLILAIVAKDRKIPIKIELIEKVLDVVIYGQVEEKTLLQVTEQINEEIKTLNEVSYTEILGNRDKEITIEISEANLEKYNLNFDQIALAINAGSIDLQGGTISTSKEDLLIRTVGQSYSGKEYENIVIKKINTKFIRSD